MGTHQRSDQGDDFHTVLIRVPRPLHAQMKQIAESEQRSLSGEVRWLMERRVREVEQLEEAA